MWRVFKIVGCVFCLIFYTRAAGMASFNEESETPLALSVWSSFYSCDAFGQCEEEDFATAVAIDGASKPELCAPGNPISDIDCCRGLYGNGGYLLACDLLAEIERQDAEYSLLLLRGDMYLMSYELFRYQKLLHELMMYALMRALRAC